jgi:hypothetical protein
MKTKINNKYITIILTKLHAILILLSICMLSMLTGCCDVPLVPFI